MKKIKIIKKHAVVLTSNKMIGKKLKIKKINIKKRKRKGLNKIN